MDIWPVSWTKWVIGEREREKIKVRAQETQGDWMFIYCRLEPHCGCEWKAVLSWTSHPLRSKLFTQSTKKKLHIVTKSPQARTHTLSESISTLHTQTESQKLSNPPRCTHAYKLNLQFPHTYTHSLHFLSTFDSIKQTESTGVTALGYSCARRV